MRKKLTDAQKLVACENVLKRSLYPKTAYEIGREIGFANGKPVREILDFIVSEGKAFCDLKDYRGRPTCYYYIAEIIGVLDKDI